MVKIRRHGDVLIKTEKNFNAGKGKFKPCKILHKGENHDHYFSRGEVVEGLIEGKRVIRVKKDAIISHGRGKSSEHKSMPIPKGDYWVEIQSEMDHIKKLKRQIID